MDFFICSFIKWEELLFWHFYLLDSLEGQKPHRSCNQSICCQRHPHCIIPSLYWAFVQNEEEAFDKGEGADVGFDLFLLLLLEHSSVISYLGWIQDFYFAVCIILWSVWSFICILCRSSFSSLVVTHLSISRSTKSRSNWAFNFHSKWRWVFLFSDHPTQHTTENIARPLLMVLIFFYL